MSEAVESVLTPSVLQTSPHALRLGLGVTYRLKEESGCCVLAMCLYKCTWRVTRVA